MIGYQTYTGRGLVQPQDRRAYNDEAARIGWPMRVCEFCGLEATTQCRQRDGGAPGWYANGGTVSCGPCRSTEVPTGRSIREAKRGLSDTPFRPGQDIV
ncbi:hypothetical protein PV661_11950 [Streptomyces sp. MD20-1-1]|uniref:hypothetical protein n=1 Tax=Streptomyces sp. MD20-1-1 TaxID=3028668 RepID=UPI0029B97569|nr:hypothetical protein [Streptomyces sp. MD20-1-1]